jgi:hypothetical protein
VIGLPVGQQPEAALVILGGAHMRHNCGLDFVASAERIPTGGHRDGYLGRTGRTALIYVVIILLALTFLLPLGCDSKAGQGITCPEVRVQYRGAIWENSLVVIIANAGAKPLFSVCVSSQRWSKRYQVCDSLKPGDSVEAGWAELPSGLQSGDVVEINAEGYGSPYRARLP